MVNILHLFPDLLNLYGDYANVNAVRACLTSNGEECAVKKSDTLDGIDLNDFDMIYIGSGTESNIDKALEILLPYKAEIKAFSDTGKVILATGTACELFGTSLDEKEALSLFDFCSKRNMGRRILCDAVFESSIFTEKTIGYINRASELESVCENVFFAHSGAQKKDGYIQKNTLVTTLIGPILVKNPHILRYICQKLTNKEIKDLGNPFIEKAYQSALEKLQNQQ